MLFLFPAKELSVDWIASKNMAQKLMMWGQNDSYILLPRQSILNSKPIDEIFQAQND
jgi:hypothetical protein